MGITIARLRVWIVSVAILLVVVLAGFLFYARYKAHRFISDLPGRIGGTIERSSDGYTYSQSVKGRTAFTIHASKAVQFKGGASATLHDVVITLYGAQGDRSDRIYGSEFNYDQKAGIVSAQGEVQIDLQGADIAGRANSNGAVVGPGRDPVHIKTRGLVFNQKTQVAITPQYVEFTTANASGHATGATYDVQKGLLILDSGVEVNSSRDGKPIQIHASHAEFLRNSMQASLLNPISDYQSDRSSADQAIVYLRKDGSAEHIDAQGHVRLTSGGGREMTAGTAKILLDSRSQPQRADIGGGVNFVSLGEPQQLHGNANEGSLLFAADGVLQHAQARDAVSFVEQQRGLSDDPAGSATRELRASQVDIDFSEDAQGRAVADKVLAAGGATAVLHTIRTKGPPQNTTVKGDQLLASLRDGHAIETLRGTGHTSVLDVSPSGASSSTLGDKLLVNFAAQSGGPSPAAKRQTPQAGAEVSMEAARIQSVTQEGNVVIDQTPAQASGKADGKADDSPGTTHATAGRADFNADSQVLRLTGSPRITTPGAATAGAGRATARATGSGSTEITADSIDYHRDTAVAIATGNVKATYVQTKTGQSSNSPQPGIGGQGPTHVIATTATLDQQHGLATFRGQARLWQGANSVAAPVIELSRNPEELRAHGEPGTAGLVATVLTGSPGGERGPDVFRVRSRQLSYSDADRKAVLIGAVVAEDSSGSVHCDQAEVFLNASDSPLKTSGGSPTAGGGQSRVERMLATGHVALQQPGRRGTGEKLIYTAADGKFILTGTSATPPRLYDQVHGTVSGEALIFNNRDNSVSVTGGQSKAVTDTRTAK